MSYEPCVLYDQQSLYNYEMISTRIHIIITRIASRKYLYIISERKAIKEGGINRERRRYRKDLPRPHCARTGRLFLTRDPRRLVGQDLNLYTPALMTQNVETLPAEPRRVQWEDKNLV